MRLLLLLLCLYLVIGISMVVWDFYSSNELHKPPKFIQDRSISTAIIFILLWPYKLLRKL